MWRSCTASPTSASFSRATLHHAAMSSSVARLVMLQHIMQYTTLCHAVPGSIHWEQGCTPILGTGQDGRADQHQGCQANKAQACICAPARGATEAAAGSHSTHCPQVMHYLCFPSCMAHSTGSMWHMHKPQCGCAHVLLHRCETAVHLILTGVWAYTSCCICILSCCLL